MESLRLTMQPVLIGLLVGDMPTVLFRALSNKTLNIGCFLENLLKLLQTLNIATLSSPHIQTYYRYQLVGWVSQYYIDC